MKTFSRIMAASALVSVAACGKLPGASLGGTFGVENFLGLDIPTESLDFPAQTYSAALGREYQNLARIAATEDVNWIDASAYMTKGLAALRGEQVQPWAPAELGLSGEVESVYTDVIRAINGGANRNPVACARALALYDNYAEELSEGAHSCTDPAVIYAELQDALKDCNYQKAAPPPPPPPEPEPQVYVEPEPEPQVYVEPEPQVYVEPEPEPVPYVEPTPQPAYPLNYTVYFGYDRCDLTAEAGQVIDEAVTAFRAYAAPFMDIVGHTDTQGSKAYNTRLAECRANAVAGSIASKGVDPSQLRVSARSELDPAMATGDGVREALNRRVSITIVQ